MDLRHSRIIGSALADARQRGRPFRAAEIGPLHRPLLRKSDLVDGEIVFFVDRCDTEALRAHWRHDASVDLAALQVDAVWGEDTLRQALDRSPLARAHGLQGQGLDLVVASHVVEHVPDLVGWLREVAAVLAHAGELRLAVPDKRYCFDILRRTSTLAQVLEAHVGGWRRPSPGQILDFTLNEVAVDTVAAWAGTLDLERLPHGHQVTGALALARDALHHGAYHDVHCWTFTPASWAGLMARLTAEGLVPFACDRLIDTARNELEFYAWLRLCDDPAQAAASWRQAGTSLAGSTGGADPRS